MTSFKGISVRFRFLVIISVILLISLISGTTFVHTMNSITSFRQMEKELDANFIELYNIDHLLHEIRTSIEDTINSNEEIQAKLLKMLKSVSGDFKQLEKENQIQSDSLVSVSLTKIITNINSLGTIVESLSSLINPVAVTNEINQLHDKYVIPILTERETVREAFYSMSYEKQRKYSINLLMVLILSILIISIAITLNVVSTNRNLRSLQDFVVELEKGSRSSKLMLDSSIEFEEISLQLNSFLDKQDEKISFLKTIGEGSLSDNYEPEKSDILGNEIKIMADRLRNIQLEEKSRQAEDQKRQWTSDGIAQFAEILRSERENVSELSFLIIQKLVTYLKIEMGTIFLTADNQEEAMLETIAAYAYDRRKYVEKAFRFGEGLPGTCALEKEKIYMDEIPPEYSDVISGVGQTKPKYILLVPLKIEEDIFGILELASFRGLEAFELDFVDLLAESIASTLLAVKTNEKTAFLLKQSQEQAEQLLKQEEEMKNNVKELEKAQEESQKKESEIVGILNAMNESSLVAEYGLNGRFTHINNKFLELLESPADMLLGKHHHEFAQVDIHSAEYKQFWEDLKNGLIISNIEQFKLFSGKEIWLQQTYTPIKNKEGKIYKILNIAVDISNAKVQQENLEIQASEITRQNLEMESLNDAVNSAIIKCELDHEGIILDTNKNFETVSGLNRKEILGRNYRLFLKDIEKEQFEKIWQEVLKGKTYQGATRRSKPTGEEAWLMSTFSPVKDEDGNIYKIYFLSLDITEKKLKYQLLEEANKEIERLKDLNS